MILVPHFTLPLGYVKGVSGAMLLSECAIGYHPETYIGAAIILGGMLSLKNRKFFYLAGIAGIAGIIHSFIMRPLSYYLQTEEPLVILSQTISIRAHKYIFAVILTFSAVACILSLLSMLCKRAKKPIRISNYYIAESTLKRKKFRSLALIACLTIVIGAFFSDILLIKSIENTLELGTGRLGADLMVVPKGAEKSARTVLLSGEPTMFYLKKNIMDTLRTFPEIENLSPQLYVQPFSYKVCCIVETILIVAYDPETDFTVAPWIQYSLGDNHDPFDIVVGKLVKFYPGQKIDLFGRKLNVAASLEPTGIGYFDNSAFIPLEGAKALLNELKTREETKRIPSRQEILDESFSHLFASDKEKRIPIKDIDPEGISAFFIKTKKDVSIEELSKKIENNFEDTAVINVRESTISVKRRLSALLSAFLLPILIIMIMGAVILGVIFSMSVNERRREIGLLRAVGAGRNNIIKIIIYEAAVLSGIGGVFGMIFGSSLLLIFKTNIMSALNLLYIWPSPKVIFNVFVLTGVTSIFIGITAALYPALRAGNMEPYHAIRSGE